MKTITLFRPVGPCELELIEASGWRARSTPGRSRATGTSRGAARDSSRGSLSTPISSAATPCRLSATPYTRSLWVPAEEMEEFNRHIVGNIEVVVTYRAP